MAPDPFLGDSFEASTQPRQRFHCMRLSRNRVALSASNKSSIIQGGFPGTLSLHPESPSYPSVSLMAILWLDRVLVPSHPTSQAQIFPNRQCRGTSFRASNGFSRSSPPQYVIAYQRLLFRLHLAVSTQMHYAFLEALFDPIAFVLLARIGGLHQAFLLRQFRLELADLLSAGRRAGPTSAVRARKGACCYLSTKFDSVSAELGSNVSQNAHAINGRLKDGGTCLTCLSLPPSPYSLAIRIPVGKQD